MNSFRDIIGLWPSIRELSTDLCMTPLAVRQMRARDSIAAEHWPLLVSGAAKRQLAGVSLEVLAGLARRRREAA